MPPATASSAPPSETTADKVRRCFRDWGVFKALILREWKCHSIKFGALGTIDRNAEVRGQFEFRVQAFRLQTGRKLKLNSKLSYYQRGLPAADCLGGTGVPAVIRVPLQTASRPNAY